MRIILFFDLPMKTKTQLKIYREFIKSLKADGYIRIQFSVYSKLCINKDAAKTAGKRIRGYAPSNGNIRYMIITETQFQSIQDVNQSHSLQEQMTTSDRTLVIGGLNNEDS